MGAEIKQKRHELGSVQISLRVRNFNKNLRLKYLNQMERNLCIKDWMASKWDYSGTKAQQRFLYEYLGNL